MFKILTAGGAAIAVAGGLYLSARQWTQQQEIDDRLKSEDRMAERRLRNNTLVEEALANLGSKRFEQASGAVATLSLVFDCDNLGLHRRSLSTAARVLARADDDEFGAALLGVLERGAESDVVDQRPKREALGVLVEHNRALVQKYNLWADVPTARVGVEPDVERARVRVHLLGRAIEVMLRSGVDGRNFDFSDIYCDGCDLSGIDLSGAVFRRAVLNEASFNDSKLTAATFTGAYMEWTTFVSADLRHARFGDDVSGPRHTQLHLSYIDRLRDRARSIAADADSKDGSREAMVEKIAETFSYGHTYFHCADLRGSAFDSAPAFSLDSEGVTLYGRGAYVFSMSDLTGADFREVDVVGLKRMGGQPLVEGFPGHVEELGGGLELYRLGMGDVGDGVPDVVAYQSAVEDFSLFFAGALWQEAKLPSGFRMLLESGGEGQRADLKEMLSGDVCMPRSPRHPLRAEVLKRKIRAQAWDYMVDWYDLRMVHAQRPDRWTNYESEQRECLLEL